MRPFQPGIAAKLSKPVRLLIGMLTLWPILYFVVFFFVFFIGFFFTSFFAFATSPRTPQPLPPQPFPFPFQLFGIVFVLQFLTIFLGYGLMALYIVDVFRNDYIANDRKALWAAVLFLGNFIAMPIYWYLYFWRDRSKDPLPPYPPYPPYGHYPSYPPYAQYSPYPTGVAPDPSDPSVPAYPPPPTYAPQSPAPPAR